MTKQVLIYKVALNNFAIQRQSDYNLADIKFSFTWTKLLAKVAICITTVEQMHQKFILTAIFKLIYICLSID